MKKLVIVFFLLIPGLGVLAQDASPEFPGRIAYIGADFNVYVLSSGSEEPQMITQDANGTRQYQWPTWSTDGRLAYFGAFLEDNGVGLDVFISEDGDTTEDPVVTLDNTVFQYAYWSPEDCVTDEGCRDLAVLLSDQNVGLLVQLFHNSPPNTVSEIAGTGAPFYYSWSPDGSRMLWQRNQEAFEIYDVADQSVAETLPQKPGLIQAPAWSPVDDRLLFGALDEETETTSLVITGDDASIDLATELSGLVSYAWSPDGNRVAYRLQTGASSFGALFVVDAVSGEIIARSPVTGVISFFWSPDSQQIAYITLSSPPGSFNASTETGGGVMAAPAQQQSLSLSWSVLHVADGATQRFGSFTPTREMLYLLQYFDQFSQSHRVWSPDSSHILYSEIAGDGPVLSLLDVTRADSIPFTLTSGVVGVWSFN